MIRCKFGYEFGYENLFSAIFIYAFLCFFAFIAPKSPIILPNFALYFVSSYPSHIKNRHKVAVFYCFFALFYAKIL